MDKRLAIVFAACTFCAVLTAGSSGLERRDSRRIAHKGRELGIEYIDNNFRLYDSLQKVVFRYAETAYEEKKSSELWASFLESQGFEVVRGAAGIPTAFVATYGQGRPVIGMMAEYDAIAGMSQDTVPYRKPIENRAAGHACGHNLLGTGSVAGAVAVSKWLAAGHAGTVKLFGCPAEEGGGGKAYMMREGVFDGLDAMLDWHPDTRNTVNKTPGLANVQVLFTFKGRASHASGAPEAGRSALDAVESFDFMMNMMREHVPQTSRIHYVITDGGKAPNVVPDRASVKYFFRSPSREVVQDILDRAIKAAEGAAMGTGTSMDYELVSGNYERLPNEAMAALVGRSLEVVGGISLDGREMEFARRIAAESGVDASLIDNLSVVVPPSEEGYEAYVSSDVGNVTWAVPTGSFRYACFAPGGVGHSWQQVSSGGMTIGTKGALGAAKVLYLSAVELLSDAGLLEEVHSEFIERRGEGFVFTPMMGNRRPPFLPPASLSRALPDIFMSNDGAVSKALSNSDLEARLLGGGIRAVAPVASPYADTSCLDVFLRSAAIRDQGKSGRCWFYATANAICPEVELSVSYPYFFDLMEKANLFLVNVWEHRKEDIDSRFNETIFRRPIWDGGHFMNAAYLIDKYGVVPYGVMEETATSQDTAPLLAELRKLLRRYGLSMRGTTEPEAIRAAALGDVRRLLCATLGVPPSSFEIDGVPCTPLSYRDSLGLSDVGGRFTMLMDDPRLAYYKVYRVEGSCNAADGPEWTFLNLPTLVLEDIGMSSLHHGKRFYFTCDTSKDALEENGVYDSSLFQLDSLLGIGTGMDKASLYLTRDVSSAHAMAMCGVKVDDGGRPVRWIAENSFGVARGTAGYVQLSPEWLRLYGFRMAVETSLLPEPVAKAAKATPEVLPYWNLY